MLGIICGSERVPSCSSRLHLLPPRLILWRVPPQVSSESCLFIFKFHWNVDIHLALFILFFQHNWNQMHPEPRRSRVWPRHKRAQSYLRSDASMVRYNLHRSSQSVNQFLYILTAFNDVRLKSFGYFVIAGLGSTSPHCFPLSKSLSCLSSFTWKGYATRWCHRFSACRMCVCDLWPRVPDSDTQVSLSMNCKPPKHTGGAAQMQTVYVALLFFPSFVGALSLVAYTVWR